MNLFNNFNVFLNSYGEKDPGFHEFTWIKSSVFVLSSLTTRGWSVTPTTNAARMTFFV